LRVPSQAAAVSALLIGLLLVLATGAHADPIGAKRAQARAVLVNLQSLDAAAQRNPGLVPVAKGNGYGFGLPRLAEETTRLGLDTLAVGTYDELGAIRPQFEDDVLVLTPWRPFGAALEVEPSARLIHTVSRLEDLDKLLAEAEPLLPPERRGLLLNQRGLLLMRNGQDRLALQQYDAAIAIVRGAMDSASAAASAGSWKRRGARRTTPKGSVTALNVPKTTSSVASAISATTRLESTSRRGALPRSCSFSALVNSDRDA